MMNWQVALRLGRVSNLPTVWTNALAGVALSGIAAPELTIVTLSLALSLFYIGGMYLNDAFDAPIDAIERPERPIPSGQVSRVGVFAIGFTLLIGGFLGLLLIGASQPVELGIWPALGGIGLAAAIIFYNFHHKDNPLSPVVMGLCRVLVYLCSAWCLIVPAPPPVWIGALLLLCYLIGLTYIAKQENLAQLGNLWPLVFLAAPVAYPLFSGRLDTQIAWTMWALLSVWILVALYFLYRRQPGDIPRAVVSLIAGIALFDGLMIALFDGSWFWLVLAVIGFGLTLFLQRFIKGT